MVVEKAPETAAEETGEQGEYGLHIRLAKEMQPVLKDAAELAHKMGDIPKPDLVNLINLFIVWGLSIQKKKWLDRMGYR
ncbi:unnamed protein product [marine sediment metagenome]|uniref:Uncharacterized protein n=1 Tax=marine sediment metagenome TaxID=412755 RepID=X1QS44_9ZZZZ